MDSLALTDHGAMYGIIEFYQAAGECGIKPIIGFEAYLAPNGHEKKRGKIDATYRHLTLLAQNNAGYKNLIKLTSLAHLSGYYYKPRIDYPLLKKYSEGLIVLSGCLNSDISRAILEKREADVEQLLAWHQEVFGRERFYLEVQHHPNLPEQKIVNEALIGLSRKHKLSLVATADSHYIHADDAEAQDVLICVQTGKTVSDTERLSMLSDDYSLTSPDDMKEAWKRYPQAVDNTQKIAEMCNVEIEFGVNRLPHYPLPKGVTADQVLRQHSEAGLAERYADTLPAEARERLDYELSVIKKTGLASYFLIVADFVNEAKRRGILVGPGRGSAAGSLVSYLNNITNIDPLKYHLLFERFLNPERLSMPDIDLDFADDRRDEIISYVREKYGHEHVAQIITFGTMAARAAVRDAGRALGYPYAFCDTVAKAIPPMMNLEVALKASPELKDLYESDPQVVTLIETARKLEGVCRHASTHAAGVVITEEPLIEHVPLQLANSAEQKDLPASQRATVTQYAMGAVEQLGLLKMDFLGLKNLTIIQDTVDRVKQRHNIEIDIDALPLADKKTYRLLQAGKTTGVFQLESSGMKRYLRELRPTEFEDIISMVALYRPGPMDSIPDFIAAKQGKKEITYLHPQLQPILEKTYGVIVTQDQVLEIARQFAGFSYAEADILRKAVGKKIKALLDEQREKFVDGATSNIKVSRQIARQVWEFIVPFARYGFNRAHATCYAMIAYQTAYLKATYPAEFMAALLTSDEGNMDRAGIEIAEALSLGLTILPPDVNESDRTFTVTELGETTSSGDSTDQAQAAIRFGLGAIKNLGHDVVGAIIAERAKGKFTDLADVFSRVGSTALNRKAVESLAKAGAFDSLADRQVVLANIEQLLTFNRALHKSGEEGQQDLFATVADAPVPKLTLVDATPIDSQQKLIWEKELLGMYVSDHPLAQRQQELEGLVVPLVDLANAGQRQPVRLAGVISRIVRITTKKGDPMMFVTIEDMTAGVELLIFPNLLKKTKDLWVDGAAVIVEGKISDKDGEPKLLTDEAWPLNEETLTRLAGRGQQETEGKTPAPVIIKPAGKKALTRQPIAAQNLTIQLPAQFSRAQLKQLNRTLKKQTVKDGAAVELVMIIDGKRIRIPTTYSLTSDAATLTLLRKLVGGESIHLQ